MTGAHLHTHTHAHPHTQKHISRSLFVGNFLSKGKSGNVFIASVMVKKNLISICLYGLLLVNLIHDSSCCHSAFESIWSQAKTHKTLKNYFNFETYKNVILSFSETYQTTTFGRTLLCWKLVWNIIVLFYLCLKWHNIKSL